MIALSGPTYLDANATAPLRPEARAAMAAMLDLTGNPSSVHRFGRLARRCVEDAREQVAALVGAYPAQIVFTAGGTEANNLALKGTKAATILVSAIEHDSVLATVLGAVRVPVKPTGLVDLEALDRLLAGCEQPALVSVMLANNETGVIQPIESVVALARAHGARVHCDAVQAAGRLPIAMAELGVDLLTLSAHKLGGPQGVGALVATEPAELAPLLRGGGQERGRRAGTENVTAISGFGAAAAAALAGLNEQYEIAQLRDALEAHACAAVRGTIIFGRDAPRLANTSCLAMPGPAAETQVMAFDLAGVAVSAGAACSSGKVRASHVLAAMGIDLATAGRAIRVSLSWQSARADIDRFAEAWTALARRWATPDNNRITLPAA